MKKIKKLLMGRTMIVAMAILIQLLWILSLLNGVMAKYSYVDTIYFIFGRSEMTRRTRKRMEIINRELEKELPDGGSYMEEIRQKDKSIYNQAKYISDWANFPVYGNTETKYYRVGEEMFPDILEALKSSEHFIFMENFIVEEGVMFNQILDILKEKAAAGVDVRFIYDDFGCVTTLPARYYETMQSFGIKCVKFNPLYPVMSVIMNNRDHRKILVVDGKIGFTGGINLSDEYINETSPTIWILERYRTSLKRGGCLELYSNVFRNVELYHQRNRKRHCSF